MNVNDIISKLPNCVLHSLVTQSENEEGWLAARLKGIGGSDIGAICGVSNFSSARQIYLKKTGQFDEDFSEVAKERMAWGHKLEAIVASEYQLRTGTVLTELKASVAHKDYPWALANVDRIMLDDEGNIVGILEVKTTGEHNNNDWAEGSIPISYQYQLNWYMWILGIERGAFACLAGGNKFHQWDFVRDDELINNVMLPAAKEFWLNNVANMIEPALQGSEADTNFVKEKYPTAVKSKEISFIDAETNELVKVIVDAKAVQKSYKKIETEATNNLKELIKDNELAYTTDYTVKLSQVNQVRLDGDAVKERYPRVFEECAKQTSYRKLNIKADI